MRVLVCGGRDYKDVDRMNKVLDSIHASQTITMLIYGMASGADNLAKMWAIMRGIPYLGFPAEWEKYAYNAGTIRNLKMLVEGKPDLVVAFPGGKGTANMIRQARKANVLLLIEDK